MKVNIIIYDKSSSDVIQKIGDVFKTRYEDASKLQKTDEFKYYALKTQLKLVSKVWIAKHNSDDLKNEIIENYKIKKEFYESLPDEIKDADKLIIAGHWGDLELHDYKDFIKNINHNQEEILSDKKQKYFVSYFGSRLSNYNGRLLSDIIPEILNMYNFFPTNFADDIVYFYKNSREFLLEYKESIKDQDDEKAIIIEIDTFIKHVDELEIMYKKLSENLNRFN